MPRPLLSVATVGAGYFSRFHRDGWTRLPRVRLVGVCDRDGDRAAATGLPAFADLTAMLRATRPDILDVILPPEAQARAIRTALDAGVGVIVCQKPFCRSLDEARALVAEAERAGATLVVHENVRFQPWYRTIRAALDAGRIGTVHQAVFRLRPGDGQGPDAYLDRQPYFRTMERFLVRETAVHWVDTFRYLFGDPLAVYADLRRLNPAIAGEDAGFVLFDHPDGVRALLDANRHLDHPSDDLRRTMGEAAVEGTAGSLRLRGDGSVRLRVFGQTGERDLLPPVRGQGFGGDCVHALQAHVVSALTEGAPLENAAADYLTVLGIVSDIYTSAQEGRKVRVAGADPSGSPAS